jgi:hypothetical protein
MKLKYSLVSGRAIMKNGIAIAMLERVGSDSYGYTLSPADTDILAHRIVNALNHMELKRQKLGGK